MYHIKNPRPRNRSNSYACADQGGHKSRPAAKKQTNRPSKKMSRWGGGASCPVCGKTVYFAEEVVAEGKKFHKSCFKCSECNKLLDR